MMRTSHPQPVAAFMFFLESVTVNMRDVQHIFYYPKSGGVFLETKKPEVICSYTKEDLDITEIIQNSFKLFLKKELQDVVKWGCKTV